MPSSWALLLASLAFQTCHSLRPDIPSDDHDLFTFVSRPDLKPPKFNIRVSEPDAVTPGYWFVAPYVDLVSRPKTSLYSAYQTGPHIYDNQGELVWSGAALFDGRTSFDFRVAPVNGTQSLSLILNSDPHNAHVGAGAGVILDPSYHPVSMVKNNVGRGTVNMHEYNVVDDGNAALMITFTGKLFELSHTPGGADLNGWMGNNGFQELDLTTGKTVFQWWALDHVHPFESLVARPRFPGSMTSAWDFFHLNSVDKTPAGDYLISARYTSTIYKISGQDGSIIWRLGGKNSSFALDGFTFSSQHDARVHAESGSVTLISFLNNGADDHTARSEYSSGMLVSVDTATMTATLVSQWDRPDGAHTKLRGNVQLLPSGSTFVSWSENAYISEYDPAGRLVLDAQWASHRFVTYRAYKFNFTAAPSEPPALAAHAYGAAPRTATTALYASWNGATEVVWWNFYGGANESAAGMKLLGTVDKSGFETVLMAEGFVPWVYAEAVAADGSVLGNSTVVEVVAPKAWELRVDPVADAAQIRPVKQEEPPLDEGAGGASTVAESPGLSSQSSGLLGSTADAAVGKNLGYAAAFSLAMMFVVGLTYCLHRRFGRRWSTPAIPPPGKYEDFVEEA